MNNDARERRRGDERESGGKVRIDGKQEKNAGNSAQARVFYTRGAARPTDSAKCPSKWEEHVFAYANACALRT